MASTMNQAELLRSAATQITKAKSDILEAQKVEGAERDAMVNAAIVRVERVLAALKSVASK